MIGLLFSGQNGDLGATAQFHVVERVHSRDFEIVLILMEAVERKALRDSNANAEQRNVQRGQIGQTGRNVAPPVVEEEHTLGVALAAAIKAK